MRFRCQRCGGFVIDPPNLFQAVLLAVLAIGLVTFAYGLVTDAGGFILVGSIYISWLAVIGITSWVLLRAAGADLKEGSYHAGCRRMEELDRNCIEIQREKKAIASMRAEVNDGLAKLLGRRPALAGEFEHFSSPHLPPGAEREVLEVRLLILGTYLERMDRAEGPAVRASVPEMERLDDHPVMIKCPGCGEDVENDENGTCPRCGRRLDRIEMVRAA